MVVGCWFLLSSLWFCLLVLPALHALAGDLDDNPALLFAPELPVVRAPALFCPWSGCSHLSPRTHGRCAAVPNCYWLILLAGDVERNPGPASVDSSLNTSDVDSVFAEDEGAPIGMGCNRSYLSCQILNARSLVNKQRDLQA